MLKVVVEGRSSKMTEAKIGQTPDLSSALTASMYVHRRRNRTMLVSWYM